MIFPNGTIRVLTPVTEDGNRPKLDANGQRIWKEDHFPASAQKAFERRNSRLPDHLKKKIERMSDGDIAQPVQVAPVTNTNDVPGIVKRRGPKPKVNAKAN